jgi:hypothetical protein
VVVDAIESAAADSAVVETAATTSADTAAADTAATTSADTAATTSADTATTDTSTSLLTNTSTDASNNPIYRFAQKTYSANFSQEGLMNGRPVSDVVSDLTNGNMSPQDLPVNYIVQSGMRLILNTRSAVALISGGIPSTLWNVVDQTGDPFFESLLKNQLIRNALTDAGTDTVRGVLGLIHLKY